MLKETIAKLVQERYSDALAVFWGDSLAHGKGTSASDIDLVIIYRDLSNAYREAFVYEGRPFDVFIHSLETLRYFFKEIEAPSGMPALMNIVLKGEEILSSNITSTQAKSLAEEYFTKGPTKWSEQDLNKERFIITDALDDVKTPRSSHEQIAALGWLYEALGQFYLISNGKWSGSGKALARRLEEEATELSKEFEQAFSVAFQTGESEMLVKLVEKILNPFGGVLWDGFRQEAPKEYKAEEIKLEENITLVEPIAKEIHDKILSGLRAYNKSKVGEYTRREFNIYMKSPEGNIIGGMEGDNFGDTVRIFMFWVDEKYRKQGVGRRLMNALEKYAYLRECERIQLDTTAFQAREFYEKFGFEVVATLDKSFLWHDLHIMQKKLAG